MTLDKPNDNEECRNCYFCTSFMRTERTGFLSKDITVERFLCKRYAPHDDLICRLPNGGGIHYILQSSTNPMVNSKGWCGEWRSRNKKQENNP